MSTSLSFVDYHTCGEPVRIVTGGYPVLTGATILDKRREAREAAEGRGGVQLTEQELQASATGDENHL